MADSEQAEQHCDCGWAIPTGAQFCPGCGKPLSEQAREDERIANAFPIRPEPEEASATVGFGSPAAIKACYWSAAGAVLLTALPVINFLFFVIYPAAGFLSVASFRRATGIRPDVRLGARLGAMTGLISFGLTLLLTALAGMVLGRGGLNDVLQQAAEQLRESGEIATAEQIAEIAQDPSLVALTTVAALVIGFALTVGLTTAGGVLGAKALDKD